MITNASKTVIFDFDGTIADSFFLVADGIKEFAPKLGIDSPRKINLGELRDLSASDIVKKYHISLWKMWKLAPEMWKYMEKHLDKVVPIRGIPEVLKQLYYDHLRMMILTSNSQSNVSSFLGKHGLNYFETICSKRSILGKAPSLKSIVNKTRSDKNNTYYIGDEVRDIVAAKKCGVKTIAVTWGFNSEKVLAENKPDFLIRKPEDLLDVL